MIIHNLPPFLQNTDVDNWVCRFDYHLHTLLQNQYDQSFNNFLNFSSITLSFSDEIKYENFKGLTIKKVKELLLQLIGNENDTLIERIERAKRKDELMELSNWIAELLIHRDENRMCEYEEAIAKVRSIIDSIKPNRRFLILGQFFPSSNTIVLYTRAIQRPAYRRDFIHKMEETFAHELFHAYHYYVCSKNRRHRFIEIYERNDYTSKVVKESLASAFENYYCSEQGITTHIQDSWHQHNVSIYPYSGAKYLWCDFGIDCGLFTNVLTKTYIDFDEALKIFIVQDNYDYYLIKNVDL